MGEAYSLKGLGMATSVLPLVLFLNLLTHLPLLRKQWMSLEVPGHFRQDAGYLLRAMSR